MRLAIAAAAMCVAVTAPAFAWDPTSASNSAAVANAHAAASSSARSGSYSGATGGSASAQGGNVTVNGAGGYSGGPLVSSATAPAIFGANACGGSGISAGVSTSILGLSFGSGNRFDDVCRLVSVGKPAAAFELLCQDDDVRKAAQAAGTPCAADRTEQVAWHYSDANTNPDWCASASPAELRKYAAVCRSALPRPIRKPGE